MKLEPHPATETFCVPDNRNIYLYQFVESSFPGNRRLEHVKQLVVNDELNFTEIAWKLHYSSVAHLSNQF